MKDVVKMAYDLKLNISRNKDKSITHSIRLNLLYKSVGFV